ncbi:helix-turn-helix domain-containing protein [Micromonospora fulviviridis]|uniref:Helix-turn-helix transcriptional regulator n=1 Tax=Micromonospora fulviviridis TaxID=47860 RepID=A0ABV2VPM4_9ACTN
MLAGELGAFLRSRREAVRPGQVGLPVSSGRRTPGLRRAELATLAGVSVEYLARLEQGRDTRPSAKVLRALARALLLSDEDIEHLHRLAAVTYGIELGPRARDVVRTVRPAVRAVLRQLEPAPSFVANHLGDLLAWTEAYERLVGSLGVLDGDPPNVLWFTFVDERARAAYPDWETVADEHVADLYELRWGDPAVDALAQRLAGRAGEAFTERWQRRPLGSRRTGIRELSHPEVGTLRLSFETLQLSDPGLRLVILLPAEDQTRVSLEKLQTDLGS